MEDASLVPDAPADRRLSSGVMLREALGADVLVHFTIEAPAVITEDTKELARGRGVRRRSRPAEKGSDRRASRSSSRG